MKIHSHIDYKKSLKLKKLKIISIQIFIFISFLLMWELLSSKGIISTFLVSKPSAIYKLFLQYVSNDSLSKHVIISLKETLLGLFFSTVIGVLIATILYLFPTIEKIFDPFLVVLNALPKTALAPILIIWAGTNIKGIVVVAVSLSIIITIISSLTYFKSVDQNLIKMMKSMEANKLQILFKIVYPSNIDNLLSVIKVNIGLSWVGVIVGEFLVSRDGIGYLLVYGGQVFQLDLVMMGVVILGIIAFIMYEIVNLLQIYIRKKLKFEA